MTGRMLGNVSRVVKSVATNQRISNSEFRKYGTAGTYSNYMFHSVGQASYLWQSSKDWFLKNHFHRDHAANYNQHRAWIKLLWKSTASPSSKTSPCITKVAQAVSLALSRTHLLVPGFFTLVCGQVAFAQGTLEETALYPSGESFYMRAQVGHAFLSSLLFSAIEFVRLLLRALHLTVLFAPSIIFSLFVESCGPQLRKTWIQIVHRSLEMAGPAFIKWGQWAATRPDLFPRDLCLKLSELQSKAPEHSFAFTKNTIEKAFGRKLSEIFEGFEEAPVASGSIAQVHRATLRFQYPGKQTKPMVVAVKVRHPGVSESIRRDFVIINLAARISKLIPTLNWLRLDESVQQFSVFMMSQVDLAREAAHLSRFIYNFRKSKDVSFPKPVYPLVHPAVLVESFEQGESVSYYLDELQGGNRIKAEVAHIGTNALLKMLLVDNFIHADMHPGNILVRSSHGQPAQKQLFKRRPHVVFLDVGMTAELSEGDRANLVQMFNAVACRDGRTAAECTLRLSKRQNCPNPTAFIKEVDEAFTFWGTPEADIIHPAECMHELLEKIRRHKVNIDGNVCTVMVTTLVLEGWQKKLDPKYNVMQTLQNMLLKADLAKSLSYTIDCLMAP